MYAILEHNVKLSTNCESIKDLLEGHIIHSLSVRFKPLSLCLYCISVLLQTLIDVNMAEWARKKGLPPLKDFTPRVLVSQFHTECLPSVQKSPRRAKAQQEGLEEDMKQPPASSSRPWTIFMGLQPEKPPEVPDLRDSVEVRRDSRSRRLQYTTKWDETPRLAPDLPLDVLQRVLFPRAFPSRIVSPQNFEPQDIEEVQHRGYPQGRSTSPWTEVAMHLAEVLEPGHY